MRAAATKEDTRNSTSRTPALLLVHDVCGVTPRNGTPTTNTWQACAFGSCTTVSNLRVELATNTEDGVVVAPPAEAEECFGPFANAGEIPPFPESAPPEGPWRTLVAAVSADVYGPAFEGDEIEGSGAFAGASSIRVAASGSDLAVYHWSLEEDEPTTVGTMSVTADVSHFKVALMGDVLAVPAPDNKFKITPGKAMFNLSATVDGTGYSVQATNQTTILLQLVNGGVGGCPSEATSCLLTSTFEISYIDPNDDSWSLLLGGGKWAAGLVSPARAERDGAEAEGCGCASGRSGNGPASLLVLGLLGVVHRRRRRSRTR